MSRGGPETRERRGGRQEGTPNKATVQKQLVAAQIAERTVADARTMGKKLAKEVLEDFMLHFADIAEQYRPTPPEAEHQNPHSDEARFNKYAAIAMECARSLAPYQSPTFKAIQIAPAPERETIHRRCQAGQISHAGRDQGRASGSRSSAVEGHSGGRV